ncbi:MAG: Beta-barrel assembly-enhancing protease [Rhodocyclaceae bacterium]|jgi:tetratricopeptide (TPR) repeat protein|nr:Beta-barrel assembly-enhancing protease [Rhodocyclaceae bacterium]
MGRTNDSTPRRFSPDMTGSPRPPIAPFALVIPLVLAACAQAPVQPAAETAPAPKERAENLPKQELTGQILYQTLLAEIAGQRGNLGLSASAYLDLARSTRDPRLARRAAEMSLHGRNLDQALQAARLWVEIDPESAQARQMMAGLLVSANRLDELQPHVAKLLEQEGESLRDGLLRLNRLFARYPDKKAVLAMVEQLTLPYIGVAEAHFARAQAALNATEWSRGIAEADKALALRPDWDAATMLKAQLQRAESPEAALETLRSYLAGHPQAREVRLQYARSLVGMRKFPQARAEFQRLLGDFPGNADVIYAVAVLSMQLADWATAEENFRKLLDRDFAEIDTVRLYLGQIAEERKQYDEALRRYAEIAPGEQYLAAQLRIAQLLAKQGKLDAGRRHLQEARVAGNADRIQLLLAESQLLRDGGRTQEAYELLAGQLAAQPEQPELLYESALLAEKLGRHDVLEANLRRLIQLKPDHAHAYNALGYSLAERNQRLAEAEQLIVKALQLSPDDPFIIDSMGWVLYRKGDPAGALTHLQRAHAIRPDPEIAAHLGEVLWVLNRRDEARRTWQEAAQAHPGNEVLAEVIKRFAP